MVSSIFNYNALLMFYNNIDNQNRVIDANWLNYELKQEIYLTQVNNSPNFDVEFIILGNTADIANKPLEVIYDVRN